MRTFFFVFVFLSVFLCRHSYASLRIEVPGEESTGKKVSVFLAPLFFSSKLEHKIGVRCAEVILNDLRSSGVFDIKSEVPVNFSVIAGGVPNSDEWMSLSSDILLTGSVSVFSPTRIKVNFFMWDVVSRKQLSGKSFNFEISNWRKAAHAMSDSIYSRIIGDRGYFHTAIVYVAKHSNSENKVSMMDYDGKNNIYLVSSTAHVSSPQFSTDGNSVAYATHYGDKGEIFLYDLHTGTSVPLGSIRGTISAMKFSPDGKKILLSCSANGNTDIHHFDLESKQFTRLTSGESINTSASYSHDGKYVVFNSDRSGVPHLYVMNADGSNQVKISSGDGMYATPSWSPKKDLIAFTKTIGKTSYLGIMKPDGSGERILAKGTSINSPTWSPNGNTVLFVLNDSNTTSKLVMTDLAGKFTKVISTPTDALSPHWAAVSNYR